nr:hypothetical protein P5668_16260 [Bacillus subtilis]
MTKHAIVAKSLLKKWIISSTRLTCKRNPAHFKKSEKCSNASSNKTFKSPKYNPYSPVPPKCSVIWVFCVQFRKIGYKPNKQEYSTQKQAIRITQT